MVPLSRIGPQGSILVPFLGPIFPGYSALEVYFMKDGVSLHCLDDDLNFLSFNCNETENAILSKRTQSEGGITENSILLCKGPISSSFTLTHRSAVLLKALFISPDCWLR